MSLLIWLPLDTEDLKNRGTLNNVFSKASAPSLVSTGKVGGGAFIFDGSDDNLYSATDKAKYWNGKEISFACWFKCDKSKSGGTIVEIGADLCLYYSYSSSGIQFGYWRCYKNSSGNRTGDAQGDSNYYNADLWHHIVVTFDHQYNKIYVDGQLSSSWDKSNLYTTNWESLLGNNSYIYLAIGRSYGSTSFIGGLVNDVRIYDHCLSQREVHDISRNLIVHYKCNLSKTIGTPLTNLVANGFGGTDNWAYKTSPYVSTDVPSGIGATNSYAYNNTTNEFIPIIQDHTYNISAYVKAISGSTACYLTIVPYDADYNHIQVTMSSATYNTASLTTLSQDLKNGDTVVYLTNMSGWTNPGTYQYYIAIFGYTNSYGYTYPDLIYTRRVYRFGSTTDKSNIDITNKKVTLLSAYSGPTIPAGTSACLTGDGGTFFYPASCSASQAQDWIQLSRAFTPKDISYLRPAQYITIMAMGSYNYTSGILLTDTTAGTTILDMSGYGHNGTMYGSFESDSTSPRYDNSLKLDGGNTSIKIGNLATLITDGLYSFNVWFKVSTFGSKGWGTIFGGPSGFEFQSKRSGTNSPLLVAYSWGQGSEGGQPYTLDEWHMLTMVRNTSNCKFYYDGNLYYTGSAGSIPSGDYFIGAWRSYSEQNYKGSISDVRLYASNLTDEDILDLYHTSATIDNLGNVSCFEIDEETKHSTTNVEQNGYLDTMRAMEAHPYLYMPAGCYIDTGLYYYDNEQCTAKTVIRYDSGGSGRDLMGYSPSGAGYWGVTAAGAWEPHGTFSYTNSDITKLNIITYIFSSPSEHGYYNIGRLAGYYSVRNKYIYNVKLYKNGVLYRDMYPYVNGTTVGLLDIYNNVFYPASGTSGAILGYDDEDNVAKIFNTHVKGCEFYEV